MSCSVGASGAGACGGPLRTVQFPSGPQPLTPPGAVPQPIAVIPEDSPGGAAAPYEEPPLPEPAPPKTVEELAKKTVQSSGDGLKQAGKAVTDTAQSAGSAVGTAVKKTWTCVSSFFGDC